MCSSHSSLQLHLNECIVCYCDVVLKSLAGSLHINNKKREAEIKRFKKKRSNPERTAQHCISGITYNLNTSLMMNEIDISLTFFTLFSAFGEEILLAEKVHVKHFE